MGWRGWIAIVWVVMVSLPMSAATAAAEDGDDDLIRVGEYTLSASHPPMVPDNLVYGDDRFVGVLTGSDGSGSSYTWTYFGVYDSEAIDPEAVLECVEAIAVKILDDSPPDDLGDAMSSCVE